MICIVIIQISECSIYSRGGVKKGISDDSQKVNHFRGKANYYILMKDYKHAFNYFE